MSNILKLKRDPAALAITFDPAGVSIEGDSSIHIEREKAIEYLQTYNTNTRAGFVEHSKKALLIHDSVRLTLTLDEAWRICKAIQDQYGDPYSNRK